MDRKKIIIFIVVFLLVGIISIGVYTYFKNKTSEKVDPDTNLFEKFNPFGTSTKTPTKKEGEGNIIAPETKTTTESTSRFYQITSFGITGAAFLEDNRLIPNKIDPETNRPATEIVPTLRYAEKSTGHIHQTFLDTKKSGKISNSTILGVYEVIFNKNANSAIYRYPSEDNSITSFLAALGGSSSFLTPDILNISLSSDKMSFFSIIKNKNGTVGIIKSFDEQKTKQVFVSPLSEWISQWVTDNNIYLTTKASYLVNGSIFNLNITTGTLTKILGGIPGLTTLANNNGELVLYGASLSSGPKLNVFNIKNHTSTDLGVFGIPEKCIWSNDNISVYCALPNTIQGTQYPDAWYQGLYSFTDYFVKIDTQTKKVMTLANSQNETPIDATNLFLSDKEDKLFFTNKKDYTLWELSL